MKKNIIFVLIVFFLVLFLSFIFWFYEAKYFVSRADIAKVSFSVDNSYLFITPLRARANGEEKIRITVFLLNEQGLGVFGKKVSLEQNNNLQVNIIQNITDEHGKAFFDVSSNVQGEYSLEIEADKIILPQKANLSFY